ncbi:MAG: S-layer domain-containing protein [Thermoanaerobacterales bacterium 50_218]|nr:MAG: S-layer domain-containing protein [Thermoanaerobacterales bacterium 50_218]HAA89566.1 hypothetical protein [Peptococcaceae bacterium]
MLKARRAILQSGPFLVAVFLTVFSLFFLAAEVEAAGVTPGELAAHAVRFLRGDFLENGVRNSDNGVGSYAVYVLKRAGVDIASWKRNGASLKEMIVETIKEDIETSGEKSAKLLAQDLLVAKELGQDDLVEQILRILRQREKTSGFDGNIYSDLSAYELLGRAGCLGQMSFEIAKSYILGNQVVEDNGAFGGWGAYRWGGSYNADLMATTCAIRALSYLDPEKADPEIQEAIERGLSWLKKQQQPNGSFVAGMDDPVIDSAEVVITLKVLGIDPESWRSSAGKTVVDYLLENALNPDGSLGPCQNVMDAVWVLYACHLLQGHLVFEEIGEAIAPEFKDIRGHWAEGVIRSMAAAGYVKGVSSDRFAPDMVVTRAQFATFLVRVLGLSLQKSPVPVFQDVPPSHWGHAAVETAYRAGLVSGVGEGRFEPERKITRQEMAVMVVRALKRCGVDVGVTGEQKEQIYSGYTDADQVSEWAKDAVAVCLKKGIIRGRTQSMIAPMSNATRAEAVVVLKNLLEYLGKV